MQERLRNYYSFILDSSFPFLRKANDKRPNENSEDVNTGSFYLPSVVP